MSSRLPRRAVRETDEARPLTGAALVDAVGGAAAAATAEARSIAFALAQAMRDGDPSAPRALTRMLDAAPPVRAADRPTVMNLLSALHFATMLPDEARADWVPPRHGVARVVVTGLVSGDALREQAENLLWALLDRDLAAGWLGPNVGGIIASSVSSSDLRAALQREARSIERPIPLIESGSEIPWALA